MPDILPHKPNGIGSNRLVFKLLYQHVSVGQMLGFFLANLFGLSIILCGFQFCQDVLPVLTSGDSFMKRDYAVVSKRVSLVRTLGNSRTGFSPNELQELGQQDFARSIAPFTPARYGVYASIGTTKGLSMGTEMFFESLPDEYIDADLSNWHYERGSTELPVILPRSYLNLYNYGYAQARHLPVITERMVRMMKIDFTLSGATGGKRMKGRIVGFSNRLNTILVPQNFMDESNEMLSPGLAAAPSRVMVELSRPTDEAFVRYLQEHGLEAEATAADGGRAAWFLRITTSLVMGVGLAICVLAFYVLLLSIFLLLQKHTERIRTLLLIGYSPRQVALPFHVLALSLHAMSFLMGLALLLVLRIWWTNALTEFYPEWESPSMVFTLLLSATLFVIVAVLNYCAVQRRIRE